MPIPDAFLEDLRDRLRLSDIIGRRVRLIRKGHEFHGLCPFHQEKTPSFTVNDAKGFYHCFGCAAHGSLFDFVMRSDSVGFRDAVERLAAEAGLTVPAESPEETARQERRRSLHDLMAMAADYFARVLRSPEGEAALAYLMGRGVEAADIERYQLGYAPSQRAGLRAGLGLDADAESDLIETGLMIRPENPARAPYDRFRDRVMFPIADARGRIVGFGGRLMGPGDAKYLNSPETPLFHKGRQLYGLHLAAEAAREAKTIIVVEGYMDVIGLAKAGYPNVVAPLGTALTEDQLKALWRLVDEPILCFDPDAAGMRAAAAAAERALPVLARGKGLRFALLSNERNYDPGDIVQRYQSPQILHRALAEAAPLHVFLFQRELKGRSRRSPERRAALKAALDGHAQRIADPSMRAEYSRVFRDMTWQRLRDHARKGVWQAGSAIEDVVSAKKIDRADVRQATEPLIIALVVSHPPLLAEVDEELGQIVLQDPELEAVRRALVALACEVEDVHNDQALSCLSDRLAGRGLEAHLRMVFDDPFVKTASYLAPDTSIQEARRAWRSLVKGLTRTCEPPQRDHLDADKLDNAEWQAYRAEMQASTEVEPD